MIDTVWPIEFGSRSPASCSSSKAMSMNKMIVGTENGTCCFAWMTDSSSFAGIISWWCIATATYSAGNVSEIASAKYRSTISAEASR